MTLLNGTVVSYNTKCHTNGIFRAFLILEFISCFSSTAHTGTAWSSSQ